MTAAAILEPDLTEDCAECVKPANGGLCHFHARDILPKLALPPWPKMIGSGYTCDGKTCAQGEHLVCLERVDAPTPRAGCQCHSCGQRRKAIKYDRAIAKNPALKRRADVQIARVSRREARKRDRAARRTGVSGLTHSIRGGLSPRGPLRGAMA